MKLDQMAAELGFDMRLDVVLARTEQLVRLESNAVIENKTIAYNLQRKVGEMETCYCWENKFLWNFNIET